MQVKKAYHKALEALRSDAETAKPEFEYVLSLLSNKPLTGCSPDELRIFAMSCYYLFLISHAGDTEKAEKAVKAFESYFETDKFDIETYEAYIVTLELTYQYKKAKSVLMTLLKQEAMKKTALKFLSSYAYAAEGLQSFEDCIGYKKELISIETDPDGKKRLQNELNAMIKPQEHL